jgi:hypothetical protein
MINELVFIVELFGTSLTFQFVYCFALILKMVLFLIFIIIGLTDSAFFDVSNAIVLVEIKLILIYELSAISALLHCCGIDFTVVEYVS